MSAELQRKLLDRWLRAPLESCLVAEDGVTTLTLVQALGALLEGDSPLRRRCCAARRPSVLEAAAAAAASGGPARC